MMMAVCDLGRYRCGALGPLALLGLGRRLQGLVTAMQLEMERDGFNESENASLVPQMLAAKQLQLST